MGHMCQPPVDWSYAADGRDRLGVCTFYEHTILFELLRSSGFPVTTLKPIETTKTKIKVGDFLR